MAAGAQTPVALLDGGAGTPGCGDVGYLSYFTFSWVNPVVSVGAERQVAYADTPRLAPAEDTLSCASALLRRLRRAEEQGRPQPLLWAVIGQYWPQLLLFEALVAFQHGLTLLKPLALQRVLAFQEAQQRAREGEEGAMAPGLGWGLEAVGVIVLLNLFEIFYNAHVTFYQERIMLRIGSGVRGAVLVRGVEGRQSAAGGQEKGGSEPSIYNVLSFDVPIAVDVIWVALGVALFPFQFGTTLKVLLSQVHRAAIPGLTTILIAKFVVFVFMLCDGFFRHLHLQAKDVRLGACNEGFNGIRSLQMLSWIAPFQERIMVARREELKYRARRLWMSKMSAALDYSLTPIVSLVTFAYFTSGQNQDLKASVALPVIDLITGLIGPIAKFPTWVNQIVCWRSAYQRVTDYLGLSLSSPVDAFLLGSGGAPPDEGGPPASFRGCSLTWSLPAGPGDDADELGKKGEKEPLLLEEERKEPCALRNLDFAVEKGQVLLLLGRAGSGKSSVLQALLGEMRAEEGSLTSPALGKSRQGAQLPETCEAARRILAEAAPLSKHAVPYAAQEVLLVAGSLRCNVLFGAREDPAVYAATIAACQLGPDLELLPQGDLTEVVQGGANLSGGQKARVGLARAAYRAALMAEETTPLVLLDDVLCALDRQVAGEVCQGLFGPGGLLRKCAVVLAAADAWFLPALGPAARVAVLRGGALAALGTLREVEGLALPELPRQATSATALPAALAAAAAAAPVCRNPQDDAFEAAQPPEVPAQESGSGAVQQGKGTGKGEQLAVIGADGGDSEKVVQEEGRVAGQVKCETYLAYLASVGAFMLFIIAVALTCIMLFQNACNLWIVYWTSEHREKTKFYHMMRRFTEYPPVGPTQLLWIYCLFVVLFTASNFAGHSLEILGGVQAARKIFEQALTGALGKPFRWWDANPTGRVLNRFSEDVEVMDSAITNILGVIFGAVLYFVSHVAVLGIANPLSLILIPVVVLVMETYARYYRKTIREIARLYLVSMGLVYQEMVEALLGKVTIRAYDGTGHFLCSSMERLDRFRRNKFTKQSIQSWVQLRLGLMGYCLGLYNTLHPLLEFWGLMGGQSAALLGFSINYSRDIMGIVQQLIMNYSDLEMQLVSIERLMEYSKEDSLARAAATLPPSAEGLTLERVEVQYREGLRPALTDVSLRFPAREACAVVGRTGAGKSSLLLSVLQLLPYTGRMAIGGQLLASLDPEDVRRRLVGVVPQLPVIFAGDLRWNLDPEGKHSESELLDVLSRLGLRALCESPEGLGSEPKGLSAGQRQLLCAARCLLRRPRVALLDEVTASLPREEAEGTVATLLGRFKELNAAVLLVTHQEELLASCERVVSISKGRVISDQRRD